MSNVTRSTLLVSLLANDESKTLVIPFFRTGTVGESEGFHRVLSFSYERGAEQGGNRFFFKGL